MCQKQEISSKNTPKPWNRLFYHPGLSTGPTTPTHSQLHPHFNIFLTTSLSTFVCPHVTFASLQPLDREGKIAKPMVCPAENPEGQLCGVVRNLALMACISVGSIAEPATCYGVFGREVSYTILKMILLFIIFQVSS